MPRRPFRTHRRAATALSRLLLCLVAVTGASGCAKLYFTALNRGTPEVRSESVRTLPAKVPGIDVYRADRADAPAVVFFYGGRWKGGTRGDYAYVGKSLAAAGITTIVPDYRLYPEVRFPTFMEDAAAAVAWVYQHSERLGIDSQRVFLSGHSAGAHIAALLATDPVYLQRHGLRPQQLGGVIGLSGPYDFLPLTEDDLIGIFSSDPAIQRNSQPVNHVDGNEPPFLLLHGDADLLVWPRNSQRLKRRLDEAGVPATLKLYPGMGHIRMLASLRFPRLGEARKDLIEFIEADSAQRRALATTP